MGTAIQSSYLKDIDVPGDKLQFGDFTLNFLVDENLENYMLVHNWLKGLGYPETTQEFKDLNIDEDGLLDRGETFCDGSLHILNSNYRDVAIVKFNDLFPISLTSLDFTASDTDINFFTAEAVFKPSNIKTKYSEIKLPRIKYLQGRTLKPCKFCFRKSKTSSKNQNAIKNLIVDSATGSTSLAIIAPEIKLPATIKEKANISR